ncbi:glycosyltransferase family 4 protein [Anaerotignum faecicola]|nr:glycosyltransferase family 4 protein [Anaerotignum faecicola]
MNIGLFTDTYFPQINGVATSTFTLAKNLRAMGHNVYIFTPQDPKNKDQNEKDVIRMPSMPCIFVHQYRFGLLYSPKELAKITKLKLDIIHTQTEFSLGMFGKTLSKVLGIPMVHTYHTMYEDYVHYIVNGALITPNMAHSFSRLFCNFASNIVAPTEKVKDSLIEYGVTKPIHVIPTGINISKFRKGNYPHEETVTLRNSMGLGENDKIILVLGRIAKEKSIDTVIKAMPYVFEKEKKAKLLIVGDGPYRKNLEHLAKELKIEDKVIFAGAKPWDEIGRYYQLGNVFVSASISETQGLTFVEAMAAGLPVVAKKDDCLKGVIEDGKTGIVFSDDSELPHKILEILENTELRDILLSHGSNFSESLSEETFAKNIEALYKKTLLENPVSHAHFQSTKRAVNSIFRMAEYEYIKIKSVNRKITKIALNPAKAVKEYIEKNENGGNQ